MRARTPCCRHERGQAPRRRRRTPPPALSPPAGRRRRSRPARTAAAAPPAAPRSARRCRPSACAQPDSTRQAADTRPPRPAASAHVLPSRRNAHRNAPTTSTVAANDVTGYGSNPPSPNSTRTGTSTSATGPASATRARGIAPARAHTSAPRAPAARPRPDSPRRTPPPALPPPAGVRGTAHTRIASASVTPSANVTRPLHTSPTAATANRQRRRRVDGIRVGRTHSSRPYAPSTIRSNSATEHEHRADRQRAHPRQRGQRREQQAVAGQRMAGVPVLVEHPEPDPFVQPEPVGLRRQVRRARVHRQPHAQQHGGQQPPPPDRRRRSARTGRDPIRYPTGPRLVPLRTGEPSRSSAAI